jgi:hypothetical protein
MWAEMAIEDDHALEAFADQAVHDRACAAAGSQEHGRAGHLLAAHEAVERDPEGGHVGVVADQAATLAGDGVDRARGVRLLGDAIHERHGPFLVRDRHVGAQVLLGAETLDGRRELERGDVQQLVAGVDALRIEGRLVHRRRGRVVDGMADEDDSLRHARTLSRSSKNAG